MPAPFIWAHRGASFHAPENTLEAFSLAREMGADGIELDVQLTKDDELIVVHDDTVDRCSSSTGRIADLTLGEIKSMDFANRKAGYRGVRAPTLAEVYALLKDSGMLINVELKFGTAPYDGIEKKCLLLAEEMNMQERIIYSSFNHYSLTKLKSLDASAKIAPLYAMPLYQPWKYALDMGAYAVHPHYMTLAIPGMMAGLNAAGIRCHPWTVDSERDLKWMSELGVAAVITNRPDVARSLYMNMN